MGTNRRAIAKALSYRIFTLPFDTFITTPVLIFAGLEVYRALLIAFGLSAILEVIHIGWFVAHERLWDRTNFGRTPLNLNVKGKD